MNDMTYIFSLLISFIVTLVLTPFVMRYMKSHKIIGRDMNKRHRPEIPEMGGVAVLIGFFVGAFLFLRTVSDPVDATTMMAVLFTLMGCAFTGVLDDLLDLRQSIKAILPFFFALPTGFFLRGMTLDFSPFGIVISSVWLVPFLIAFGVTCGANATNMLDGLNGLCTGLTLIASTVLLLIAYLEGKYESLWILFPLVGALGAFLLYNRYPAKVFPGDVFTLSIGGIIVTAAIIGGLASWGIILFAPMIVEFFLKARGRFRGRNYGYVALNGWLYYPRGDRIESMTHIIMHFRPLKEWKVVGILWLIEAFIGISVILCVVFLY
ncbi:MAG: hypothetical protein WC974_00525 [Thermoplasmata archaeon]